MYLQSVELENFRSWPHVHVEMTPGVTAFIGSNGQGKTNIIEAIYYMATLSSHRVSQDGPLIRMGQNRARMSIHVINHDRELRAHILLNQGKSKQAQINRTRCKSPREILGILKAVLFSPEDLVLVRGEPADRRRYLDEIIAFGRPRFLAIRTEYDKVLKQRNAVLKMASKNYSSHILSTLEIWDAQLAHLGALIISLRLHYLYLLEPYISAAYYNLAPSSRPAYARYFSHMDIPKKESAEEYLDPEYISQLEELLCANMASYREKEIERGISLIGPHRDDIELILGDQPAKGFASHGETWSFALALKIAVFSFLRQSGTDPVLILDDVFSELDAQRRQALISIISDAEQVIITAAVSSDLPEEFFDKASIYHIRALPDSESDSEYARISSIEKAESEGGDADE